MYSSDATTLWICSCRGLRPVLGPCVRSQVNSSLDSEVASRRRLAAGLRWCFSRTDKHARTLRRPALSIPPSQLLSGTIVCARVAAAPTSPSLRSSSTIIGSIQRAGVATDSKSKKTHHCSREDGWSIGPNGLTGSNNITTRFSDQPHALSYVNQRAQPAKPLAQRRQIGRPTRVSRLVPALRLAA